MAVLLAAALLDAGRAAAVCWPPTWRATLGGCLGLALGPTHVPAGLSTVRSYLLLLFFRPCALPQVDQIFHLACPASPVHYK